ncbi:hypothetical protein PR048_023623 [Dryococelus australis]|uniref:Uncharacterized protein n=1 Tax=Dryococelus australis TaxID=614101 RepID=A0ABQ9GUT9_9NEOP|nr:hypothetical protein PR048_023623 [Dryococelus australis]
MQGRGKQEIPEKTCRPAVKSRTIPTCVNPEATPPRFEPGSPRWEANKLGRGKRRTLRQHPPRFQQANIWSRIRWFSNPDRRDSREYCDSTPAPLTHTHARARANSVLNKLLGVLFSPDQRKHFAGEMATFRYQTRQSSFTNSTNSRQQLSSQFIRGPTLKSQSWVGSRLHEKIFGRLLTARS